MIGLRSFLMHQSESLDQLPQMRASLRSRKLLSDTTPVGDQSHAVA